MVEPEGKGNMKEGVLRGLAMAVVVAAPMAIPVAPATAQPTEGMLKCARIVDNEERVACYDQLVAQQSAAAKQLVAERQARTEQLMAEREAARQAEAEARKRERFGGDGLGLAPTGERLEALDAKLVETFTDTTGLMVFLLDNGQVWKQTDGVFRGNLKPGAELSIKRTRLGGFLMTFPGTNRTVNVKRLR